MPDVRTTVYIKTSDDAGEEYCDHECEHLATYTSFPPVAICKITGVQIEADKEKRFSRPDACKYMCCEQVEERFWSPLKGT